MVSTRSPPQRQDIDTRNVATAGEMRQEATAQRVGRTPQWRETSSDDCDDKSRQIDPTLRVSVGAPPATAPLTDAHSLRASSRFRLKRLTFRFRSEDEVPEHGSLR